MRCAVIQFAGSSGDSDCYYLFKNILGTSADYVFHKETFKPADFDVVVLPGGASHGDYLRPGALAAHTKVMESVKEAAKSGKLILGIGNGFQILLEAGLLPGTMLINKDIKFYADEVLVKVENNATPFTNLYKKDEVIRLILSCKYGSYFADAETIEQLKSQNKIVLTYCGFGKNGNEEDPVASMENIAAIANQEGNILGLMPHPERCAEEILGNTDGLRMFQSILQYFEGGKTL